MRLRFRRRAPVEIRAERYDTGRVIRYEGWVRNQVVGQADVTQTQRGYGYLHGLHVTKGYRRRGVATAIVDVICDEWRRQDMELICTPDGGISEENLAAFYSQWGFEYGQSAGLDDREPRESDARRMILRRRKETP